MANKRTKPPRAPFGFRLPDRAVATEFWVVRHGESTWNASGRYQGQADVPLSRLGRLQVVCLAERLMGQSFGAVYSSDLLRARETAETVAARLSAAPAVQLDPALREIHVGHLAGLTSTEIAGQYPDYVEALRQDAWRTRRPGGESMEDLFARGRAAFEALRQRHPGERVLVFTHGGMVRVAVGLALGCEAARQSWAHLSVTNSGISRVLLGPDGSGTLLGFNDDAHLEDLLRATETDDVLGEI
ncbi:histidine phosphatase family protein [Deinococcus lacus]|uniref:Histidine phosphatase family protein n=1 Tax=Deinococcus lacus TaxID=392561 RepID=A0ABW1Y8Q7_9DEIO